MFVKSFSSFFCRCAYLSPQGIDFNTFEESAMRPGLKTKCVSSARRQRTAMVSNKPAVFTRTYTQGVHRFQHIFHVKSQSPGLDSLSQQSTSCQMRQLALILPTSHNTRITQLKTPDTIFSSEGQSTVGHWLVATYLILRWISSSL